MWHGDKTQICKSALCSLYVVGCSRLGNILRLTNRGQISLYPFERCKHLSRPNRFPIRQVNIVLEQIEIFTGKSSHHSRNQKPNENICHALYPLPNYMKKEWCVEQACNPVSSWAYRDIFCTRHNFGSGSTKKWYVFRFEVWCFNRQPGLQRAQLAYDAQMEDKEKTRNKQVHYLTFEMEKTLPFSKLTMSYISGSIGFITLMSTTFSMGIQKRPRLA